jgi:hypothetical protein
VNELRRGLSPIKRRLLESTRFLSDGKPDFLIIGAQKSGTTSLYQYMQTHPRILMSSEKEIHYFDYNYEKELPWYLSQFPLKYENFRRNLIGEATPNYLYHPPCAERIGKVLPETRLIALLRNPVERAISHYFFEVRRDPSIETKPILEALIAEEERVLPFVQELQENPYSVNPIFSRLCYKARGRYCEQLLRYEEFFKKGYLLVLQSEEFFRKPAESLRQVAEFLGIPPVYGLSEFTPRNVGANKAEVPEEVYKYLEEYFKPHNQNLYEFLGQEFSW